MMSSENKKAVVLLSGGIDSSTTLAVARAEGYECYALSFDYAQRHKRELESARRVADALGVVKHMIIRFDLTEIGGSALTDRLISVPKKEVLGEDTVQEIPVTYVPARNTIFLSFALGWAEVLEADTIFIGANAVDYSGYPDCRPEYLEAFERMANLATKISVEGRLTYRIKAPLLYLTKSEIIRKGMELGLDYSLTWSCYDPRPDGRPCLSCDSCLYRLKGFEEIGVKDPLLESSGL
ncbi:MAG: 7-cyano-7-deazaguanine synthase QueC [Nitrospirae bacterium]|nr:7-cyano-7-deazaguanine synthase QueC [Nitrospirota bacterium]